MTLKKAFAGIAACAALVGLVATAQAAPIKTDIIMIVDESGSMGNVQTNLRNNIGLFASILDSFGIDARYGLVGYGSSTVAPRMLTDLTTAASFATAAQGLLTNGGTEPGYTASAFALNGLDNQTPTFSFRSDAVKNLIIYTDEPSNGDTTSRGAIGGAAVNATNLDALIKSENALYNAVLRGSGTINSYSALAIGNFGAVFDLNSLNTTNQDVVRDFVVAFAEAKAQETIDFCDRNPNDPACQNVVSTPGTLALAGLGLFGLAALRRRVAV
jgi:MYXO-CTERM domain-containing protein